MINFRNQPAAAETINFHKAFSLGFSFGPRRYASKGPRRLFLAQKCLVSPTFEPEVERPKALLHLHSSFA